MTVLAIGDSNVEPGVRGHMGNCAHAFSRAIGHRDAHCWGKGGASNHWVLANVNTILDNIDQYSDPVFFVGWTQWEREEWEWEGQDISVCIGPHFPVPKELEQRYNDWRSNMTNSAIQDMRDFWHELIHNVHVRMTDMDIPHQFWSTYDNFIGMTGDRQLNWDSTFFMPYEINGCMSEWFTSNNIEPVQKDQWHWTDENSTIWGNTLATQYKERMNK